MRLYQRGIRAVKNLLRMYNQSEKYLMQNKVKMRLRRGRILFAFLARKANCHPERREVYPKTQSQTRDLRVGAFYLLSFGKGEKRVQS